MRLLNLWFEIELRQKIKGKINTIKGNENIQTLIPDKQNSHHWLNVCACTNWTNIVVGL